MRKEILKNEYMKCWLHDSDDFDKEYPTSKIIIDDSFDYGEANSPSAKYPIYKLRGKPVSREAAMQLIAKTDAYLWMFNEAVNNLYRPRRLDRCTNKHTRRLLEAGVKYIDSAFSLYFENDLAGNRDYGDGHGHGWIAMDGTIGADEIIGKNPFLYEMVLPWLDIIEMVDVDLDIVIAITDEENYEDKTRPFEDQIITVYHVHGKIFEELPLVKGKILFKQYDRLYGDKTKFASANPLTDADYDEITEMLIKEWNAQQSHKASGKD